MAVYKNGKEVPGTGRRLIAREKKHKRAMARAVWKQNRPEDGSKGIYARRGRRQELT